MVKCIPVRYQIALMIFLSCFTSYIVRVDISLIMLELAEQEATTKGRIAECVKRRLIAEGTLNYTEVADDDTGEVGQPESWSLFSKPEKFPWSKDVQARIRGGYYYGYMAANLIGGPVVENFGPRLSMGIGLIFSGIVNCVMPACVYVHWSLLWVIRIIIGVGSGFIYPGLQVLIARWAPPKEKGRFVMGTLGGAMGSVFTFIVVGFLCEQTNWIVATLFSGLFSLAAAILIIFIVYNRPEEHPRISPEELSYIQEEISGVNKNKKKHMPPIKAMLMCLPVWSLMFGHFSQVWGSFFLLTSQPQYMADVMGLRSSKAGIFSCLPHLARVIFGVGFSSLRDWISTKKLMSDSLQRKIFILFSHILLGTFLASQSLNECSLTAAVLLPTIALAANSAALITVHLNPQHLAPNFAGTIYGACNFLASSTGFIASELVGLLTKGKREYDLLVGWKYVYLIAGVTCALGGVQFFFLGSTKRQKFNDVGEVPAAPQPT